jgi:hypothetical protein
MEHHCTARPLWKARHTSKGPNVTILDLQDGRRQQQYIDHLEGEVERLQQLLQVRPAECGTAALHQRQIVIAHACGWLDSNAPDAMLLMHRIACCRWPTSNRLGRGRQALRRAADLSRQTPQQTTPQPAQVP